MKILHKFKGLLALSIFAFSLLPAISQAASDFHEYNLHNGLKLLVKEEHHSPQVWFGISYRVGGSYERDGYKGLSHLLEHLMFRGTARFPEEQLNQQVEANGGSQNALTNYNYTLYYRLLPKENVELNFQIEADRMQNLQFMQSRLREEKKIVKEELHMRVDDNSQAKIDDHLSGHNTIGSEADINSLTLKRVKWWYDNWYVPNNATLIIVGDVNAQEMFQMAEKYFSNYQSKRLPNLKHFKVMEKVADRLYFSGEPKVLSVNVDPSFAYLSMSYYTISLATAKCPFEAYALEVIATLLAKSYNSRLLYELHLKKNMVSDLRVDFDYRNRKNSFFKIEAWPLPEQSNHKIKQAILEQIEKLKSQPVSAAELKAAKARIKAEHIYAQDQTAAELIQLAELDSAGLPWTVMENFPANIDKVTAKQIQYVAKKYFTPGRLSITMLEPVKPEISKR